MMPFKIIKLKDALSMPLKVTKNVCCTAINTAATPLNNAQPCRLSFFGVGKMNKRSYKEAAFGKYIKLINEQCISVIRKFRITEIIRKNNL